MTQPAMLACRWSLARRGDLRDVPIDRFECPRPVAKPAAVGRATRLLLEVQSVIPSQHAKALRKRPGSLDSLARRDGGHYEHLIEERPRANLVVCGWQTGARIMVIGEGNRARRGDRVGQTFVARRSKLDAMFSRASGLARMPRQRGSALYITNVLPWRPAAKTAILRMRKST